MSVQLNVALPDELSPKTFANLVIRLIKYIAYNCQNIPYTYEGLQQLINNKRNLDRKQSSEVVPGSLTFQQISANSYFKKVEKIFNIFESTFENLVDVFSDNLNEIIDLYIVLGCSLIAPKHVYRIQAPYLTTSEDNSGDVSRKNLFSLHRNILESDDFNGANSREPMNMYLLLNSRSELHNSNKWFLPKNGFSVPLRSSLTSISFHYELDRRDMTTNVNENHSKLIPNKSEPEMTGVSYWYTAKESMNCIKDLVIEGTSAYNIISNIVSKKVECNFCKED